MTIVIAQKKDDRILILSDTMVTDEAAVKSGVIPGRLKVAVLNSKVAVAFSGAADRANDSVIKARDVFAQNGIAELQQFLKNKSLKYDIDFFLASHVNGAKLYLIRNGGMLECEDVCSIGCDDKFSEMIGAARKDNIPSNLWDSRLRDQFIDFLTSKSRSFTDPIGGFPVCVLGTHKGYTYLSNSGTMTWQFPRLITGKTVAHPDAPADAGQGHYEYSIVVLNKVGTPVVGAILPQAKIAYVYSPFKDKIPEKLSNNMKYLSWSEQVDCVRKELQKRAENLKIRP